MAKVNPKVFDAVGDTDKVAPQPPDSKSTRKATNKKTKSTNNDLVASLLAEKPEKEPTVRITLDLPQSLYDRLHQTVFKSKSTKAKILRYLLDQHLPELDD